MSSLENLSNNSVNFNAFSSKDLESKKPKPKGFLSGFLNKTSPKSPKSFPSKLKIPSSKARLKEPKRNTTLKIAHPEAKKIKQTMTLLASAMVGAIAAAIVVGVWFPSAWIALPINVAVVFFLAMQQLPKTSSLTPQKPNVFEKNKTHSKTSPILPNDEPSNISNTVYPDNENINTDENISNLNNNDWQFNDVTSIDNNELPNAEKTLNNDNLDSNNLDSNNLDSDNLDFSNQSMNTGLNTSDDISSNKEPTIKDKSSKVNDALIDIDNDPLHQLTQDSTAQNTTITPESELNNTILHQNLINDNSVENISNNATDDTPALDKLKEKPTIVDAPNTLTSPIEIENKNKPSKKYLDLVQKNTSTSKKTKATKKVEQKNLFDVDKDLFDL